MDEASKYPIEALSTAAEAHESTTGLKATVENTFQNPAADTKCSGPEVPEKGHQAKGGQSAHLAYNKDGYYTRAAACYIYNRFKAVAKR
jgi:hypothetical protein